MTFVSLYFYNVWCYKGKLFFKCCCAHQTHLFSRQSTVIPLWTQLFFTEQSTSGSFIIKKKNILPQTWPQLASEVKTNFQWFITVCGEWEWSTNWDLAFIILKGMFINHRPGWKSRNGILKKILKSQHHFTFTFLIHIHIFCSAKTSHRKKETFNLNSHQFTDHALGNGSWAREEGEKNRKQGNSEGQTRLFPVHTDWPARQDKVGLGRWGNRRG